MDSTLGQPSYLSGLEMFQGDEDDHLLGDTDNELEPGGGFPHWAVGAGLNSATVQSLVNNDCSDLDTLKLLSVEDVKSFRLSVGQQARVMNALGKLKEKDSKPSQPILSGGQPKLRSAPDTDLGTLEGLLGKLGVSDPIRPQMATRMADTDTLDNTPPHLRPEVYLRTSLAGETHKHLDIVDYVAKGFRVEEEELIAGSGATRIVIKSGASKPKLESVTTSQWLAANARIMAELLGKGLLKDRGVLQYLAYTAKVGDLGERFDWKSVLVFDREYRVAQANHGFPWGSDAGHLSTVFLREKVAVNDRFKTFNANGVGPNGNRPYNKGSPNRTQNRLPYSNAGRDPPPCRLFNKGNCDYKICRFSHICSVPGCSQPHAEVDHKPAPTST